MNSQLPLRGMRGSQSLVRSSIDHILLQFPQLVLVVLVLVVVFELVVLVLVVVFELIDIVTGKQIGRAHV